MAAAKISINSLLMRADLLTIAERRKLSLIKIAWKFLANPIFDNWLTPSPRSTEGCLPKLIVSRENTDSIKWNLVKNWNYFLKECKPPPNVILPQYVSLCQEKLLELRNSDYVT